MSYKDIIDKVLAQYPDLDISGLEKQTRDGENDDWTKHEAAFAACREYIAGLTRLKTYSKNAPLSYGLKHDVERRSEAKGKRVYVPNGVFIAALIEGGVEFKRAGINAIAKIKPSSRWQG